MPRVVVFGSINMDVVAFAPRHPGVGETVKGSELHLLPGGKGANQAVAAKRGGATTALAGRLGEDAFASELRAFLQHERIELELTESIPAVSTGTALIAVAESANTIVVVPGANGWLDADAAAQATMEPGDVVVAQFETPQETTLAAFSKAREVGAVTVLNPAPAEDLMPGLLEETDILVVNETELAVLSNDATAARAGVDTAVIGEVATRLRFTESQTIIVTLGAEGALVCSGDDFTHLPGRVVEAVDTTGAGDCFVGNFAAALVDSRSIEDAAARGNLAASLCVQVVGAGVSMPTKAMVDDVALDRL